MSSLIALLSNVVYPVLTIRRKKPFVREKVHVLDELQAFCGPGIAVLLEERRHLEKIRLPLCRYQLLSLTKLCIAPGDEIARFEADTVTSSSTPLRVSGLPQAALVSSSLREYLCLLRRRLERLCQSNMPQQH
jgi:hypothetical protein